MVPAGINEPEIEPDTVQMEQRLQEHGMYNEALVYGFIAACFGRIDVIRCSSESCIESVLVEWKRS